MARLRAKDPAKGRSGKEEDDDDRDDDDKCEKLLAVAGEVEYRYDAAHNIVEQRFGGRSIRSTFDAANQMLTRGSMSFKYSEKGDQTEKVHKSGRLEVFGYSASGKLASYATGHVKQPDRLKEVERYMYSPDHERVVVEEVQGKKLQFSHWDGSRQIEEWAEHGHGAGRKEKGRLYTRDLGGQLLEQARFTRRNGRSSHASEDDDHDEWDGDDDRRGDDGWRHGPRKPKLNHVRFVMPDFLSSDSVVTNHRGRVLDRREFAPFGVPLAGNFKKMPFGYTGHRAEAQTGHWIAFHRHLDPRAGRWMTRDRLGAVDGQNRYAYVANRAMSAVDPVGLRLVLKGAVADQQSLFKRLQALAAVDLKLLNTGEVVFAQCPAPVRLGAGHVAVRRLLSIPQLSTWTLEHGIRIDWAAGGPGDLNVDMDDFAQLDAQKPHRDKWTADDVLIHELWEQWHVLVLGGGYDDSRAHQKAMELES